ncbi:MAG: hypothetical protein HFJ79_05345 [Clostridiales bacterium]|jgi:hypothetical protein|nr:hypothetical protein [Clostridiales bacterium]
MLFATSPMEDIVIFDRIVYSELAEKAYDREMQTTQAVKQTVWFAF